MDTRPIGVLDSGLGGLTALRTLKRMLPGENIVFFGDTKRVPYGEKSPEAIAEYSYQCLHFLESRNVKFIIVACGTISSVLGDRLKTDFSVPVMGVLEPTIASAAAATRTGKVALIATPATIQSGAYEKLMKEKNPDIRVYSKACPLFVPLVENGYFDTDCIPARLVVEDYLKCFRETDVDTMILGCTHYPLLSDLIADVTEHRYRLISAGDETAKEAVKFLGENGLMGAEDGGTAKFYVTDRCEGFASLGEKFLGEGLGDVELITF